MGLVLQSTTGRLHVSQVLYLSQQQSWTCLVSSVVKLVNTYLSGLKLVMCVKLDLTLLVLGESSTNGQNGKKTCGPTAGLLPQRKVLVKNGRYTDSTRPLVVCSIVPTSIPPCV
eukprot:Lithocolla_globosa_v1_NODE_2717_length_1894_cov_17.901577.p3 type:complete len:114 gc:universal NODE_2717_length_1894_cov_17.901577:1393-1734(+)